jgi:hypothetical protein
VTGKNVERKAMEVIKREKHKKWNKKIGARNMDWKVVK